MSEKRTAGGNAEKTMYIEDYLDKKLYFQLRERGIKYRYIQQVQNDIKNRMYSLLSVWSNKKKREAILLLAREEANYYIPKANDDVRAFVVTTIRNSMLEIAASDSCMQFKMSEPLSNEDIQQITQEAILFFDGINFEILEQELDTDFTDVYEEAIKKYPLAWKVIFELANMETQETVCDFRPSENEMDRDTVIEVTSPQTVICDGYTLEFDDYLKQVIGEVISGMADIYYSDCFKMISRNFEKVLHVLQILLENDCVVCTSNYYISTKCLSKRSKLVRAAHTEKDAITKQSNLSGTTGKLREVLSNMIDITQD